MKCKLLHIRLKKRYRAPDEAKTNEFLEGVNVKRIFAAVRGGLSPFWSALVFYEPEPREEGTTYVQEAQVTAEEEELYGKLRAWRNKRALEEDVPPYMIAHNAWLRQMVKLRPRTKEDLIEVKGFGAGRTERYGDDILRIFRGGRQG